jgi:hypothetical protein
MKSPFLGISDDIYCAALHLSGYLARQGFNLEAGWLRLVPCGARSLINIRPARHHAGPVLARRGGDRPAGRGF